MRLGAVQPGYLPWLGFFDQIACCDVFILYDDLPYSRHSWRNRNKIKTPHGWGWLTVPVVNRGLCSKSIREVEISSQSHWGRGHWNQIRQCYARAPYFQAHEAFFATLYERSWRYLADLDLEIIFYLLGVLGIETKILISSQEGLERDYRSAQPGGKDPAGRVAFLCRRLGAQRFLEGAVGRSYIDPSRLESLGITLEFHDYRHPSYYQLYGSFIPYLSVIDLLFNHGPDSLDILTGQRAVALP
ncbi:MAG: WbqC family protein [candidate division NC10 bacterium]|nr:WbqC family protein [candidate division NC10 bacterium]MDE2321229.1 WbqC family protein [candidate division NC10 bacterium]